MPSKKKNRGSPLVALRIPKQLLQQIDKQIESCNRTRREEPYTRSSFIIAALVERFEKYGRARKASKRKKGPTQQELLDAANVPNAIIETLVPLDIMQVPINFLVEPVYPAANETFKDGNR